MSTLLLAKFIKLPPSMPNDGNIFVFYASNAIRESIVASREPDLSSRANNLDTLDVDACR